MSQHGTSAREMLALTLKGDFSEHDRNYLWDTFSRMVFAEEWGGMICPVSGTFIDETDETLWRIAYPRPTQPRN